MEFSNTNIRVLFEGFPLSDDQIDALLSVSDATESFVVDIYEKYNHYLTSRFDVLCSTFDNAPSETIFDKAYAVNTTVSERDCNELLAWLLLHKRVVDKNCPSFRKECLKLFGRFTLLFIGDESLKSSITFRSTVLELFDILLSCNWSYEEALFLRITILNALLLLGVTTRTEILDLFNKPLQHLKEVKDQATIEYIQETISWYISFMAKKPTAEEIKLDWLHAYIYKVRFGFIYCRKFSRSSDKRYPILMSASSPIFGIATKENVGTGAKGLFLEKGEKKRNSEYRPLESNVFYNTTLGLFE